MSKFELFDRSPIGSFNPAKNEELGDEPVLQAHVHLGGREAAVGEPALRLLHLRARDVVEPPPELCVLLGKLKSGRDNQENNDINAPKMKGLRRLVLGCIDTESND